MEEKNLNLSKEQKIHNYTNKIMQLNELSKIEEKSNPEKSYNLSKEAYKLAEEIDYSIGKADSLLNMAFACRVLSRYEESMICLHEAHEIYEKENKNEELANVYNLLGINYFYFGNYKTSLNYFMRCLELKNYIYKKSLLAGIYNNIGEIYRKTENYKDALLYYDQALDIIEKDKNLRSVGVVLLNKGLTYHRLKNYDKAIENYNKGLEKLRTISDDLYIAMGLNGVGEIYFHMKEFDIAEKYLKESLKLYTKQKNKYYQIEVLISMGKLYKELDDIDKAYKYTNLALTLAKEIEAKDMQAEIYKEVSNYYESKTDYKESLEYYKLYNEMKDKIRSEELNRKLENMTIDFRIQKSKQEAEIYKLRNVELKQKSLELEAYAKELERTKEDLHKLIESREKLFSNISHDLRTPVAAIRGYTEALKDDIVKDEQRKNIYLNRILDKTNTLSTMINDLFELTKLESGQIKFNFQRLSLSELFNWIHNKFKFDINRMGKEFIIENNLYNQDIWISIDVEKINRVVSNIIDNAINHSHCRRIKIVGILNQKNVKIQIIDDGKGIKSEDISYIFERFYKASKSRSPLDDGSGLGLAISKEIIEQQGGEIWVESEENKGSSFIFTLPIQKNDH